jgi:hypothetical protein
MNNDDATALLALHRPGRTAEGRVLKAVRQAEKDATLADQLAAQTEFDQRLVDVLNSITPPENLRQKLREAGARDGAESPKLRSQALNPAVITAALGVLLIVGFLAWSVMERMEKFEGRDAAERMLSSTSKMTGVELDPMTATTGGMEDWFYMRGFEGYSVPPEIAALPVVGSRVFRVDSHAVAQLTVDRHDSWLYVFHASDFGIELPEEDSWRLIRYEGWVAALRRRGDTCWMLAFHGKKSDMREFLAGLEKR